VSLLCRSKTDFLDFGENTRLKKKFRKALRNCMFYWQKANKTDPVNCCWDCLDGLEHKRFEGT